MLGSASSRRLAVCRKFRRAGRARQAAARTLRCVERGRGLSHARQNIPEDEGGRAGTGSSSVTFEGPGADKEDSRRQLAGALGTGNGLSCIGALGRLTSFAVSLKGDDPAARSVQDEVVASTDAPSQPQLQPQEENPYDA